ncbi:hypothetical protein BJ322DRAFT_1105756 [Thelephora terrestris]|uniref:F-box domain-containing protein n=1 Tax=Thelephora terrestris TaxID=56493 RepID=A0A9P6LB03_9AGAM|nr:hypothetical protein BJ322DRAFT_1105756 [Thelephora terrestris]
MSTRAKGQSSALRSTIPQKIVSTDLDSYNRSDPFAAMNALRKLFSSLATKPGTRQYKMTPEEHKLSMHLLMIVGPFVCSTPSPGNISRLPVELLDKIAFYVDSKNDVLYFALTCQWIHSAVFSAHFEYRVIKAKIGSVEVWRHIIGNSRLAHNVRRLEIVDERSSESQIIPQRIADTDAKNIGNELDLRAELEKLLVSAIANMDHLQEFKWSCTTSLVSIKSLLPTLHKLPHLRLVDLNDNAMFSSQNENPEEEDEDNSTEEDPALTEMTTVSVHSSCNMKNPQLIYITGLLTDCPNLQNLDIRYMSPGGPIADEFYSTGSWKNLTSLTLNNLRCTAQGHRILAVFFSEHQNLETLHFDSQVAQISALAVHLPLDILPRLKELNGPDPDKAFLENLARIGGEISRVELAGWKEMDDLRKLLDCVPKLTWLDVGNRRTSEYTPNKAVNAFNADDWATLLQRVPEIKTFFGVKLFSPVPTVEKCSILSVSDRSKVKKNKETASRLASRCKKLRRLDHWDDGGSKVIILSREGNEKYQVKRMIQENANPESSIE